MNTRTVITALLLALSLGASASSGPARADELPQRIQPALGNTVLVSYPDGLTQKLWLQPKGVWLGESRHGRPRKGTWRLSDDGSLCLKQTEPKTVPLSYCAKIPPVLRVGAQWTGRDVLGRPVAMSLVQGVINASVSRSASSPALIER